LLLSLTPCGGSRSVKVLTPTDGPRAGPQPLGLQPLGLQPLGPQCFTILDLLHKYPPPLAGGVSAGATAQRGPRAFRCRPGECRCCAAGAWCCSSDSPRDGRLGEVPAVGTAVPATWLRVFVVATLIALPVYAIYPLAPPRFMDRYGYPFVDTLARFDPTPTSGVGSANPYAAMPSMHIGWSVIAGLFLAAALPWRRLGILLGVVLCFLSALERK